MILLATILTTLTTCHNTTPLPLTKTAYILGGSRIILRDGSFLAVLTYDFAKFSKKTCV